MIEQERAELTQKLTDLIFLLTELEKRDPQLNDSIALMHLETAVYWLNKAVIGKFLNSYLTTFNLGLWHQTQLSNLKK